MPENMIKVVIKIALYCLDFYLEKVYPKNKGVGEV